MAVDDILSRDTDSYVLPSKTFYPLKIPITHYQLRHFISSPEPDLIYYASGPDVFCLNVATKVQALVTKLPFEARCTASGYGWVCVGGEKEGNFAAIEVAGFPPTDPSAVDALLPLGLSNRTSVPRPPVLGAPQNVTLDKIGDDIVNSISIHKFPTEGDGKDDVVAVLTNNDNTVRIYSLTLALELTVLDLPMAMNHATISPDGNLMVAVGDEPQAFFFERVQHEKPSVRKTPEGRPQLMPSDWSLLRQVNLHLPPGAGVHGYFTTAWSPSGRLCAVGSECGYITVFAVEIIKSGEPEDPVVQVIRSTRPDSHAGPGAVRTMQFSPSPWDLLVWSEDQSRVCVADIRTDFNTLQILELDPNAEHLQKIEVADLDVELSRDRGELRREADFIRRYRRALDAEDNAAAINFATDYIDGVSPERRRLQRQLGIVESDNDPLGLTAHERQIIATLHSSRQRDEAQRRRISPLSINYNAAGSAETRRYGLASLESIAGLLVDRSRGARRESDNDADADESLAELLRESQRPWDVLSAAMMPRRQASVVFTNGGPNRSTETNGANITDSPRTRSPNSIPAHARRAEASIQSAADEAWRTIEAVMERNARATASSAELRGDRRLRLNQARERLRNARDALPATMNYDFGSAAGAFRRHRGFDSSHGVRTAGLAMSQDGRKLYCATEDGIFEFDINVHGRKSCPAVAFR